jgi:hypothetical protein
MVSPTGGSSISRQEAIDLLSKLVTEKTKVQAIFVGISLLGAGLIGIIFPDEDGTVSVKSDLERDGPFLRFDPRAATSFRYGDNRVFRDAKITSPSPNVASALAFIFPDKTLITLFEIAVD